MKRCLVLALGLFGCSEEVESNDVRTSGIYPEFEVVASGDGTSDVEVRLKVGGSKSNTLLDLTGDDTLEVTADGVTKTLEGRSGNRYTATFNVDAGGTEFIFAFLRGDDDDSAPMSTVRLPAPFEMEVTSANVVRTVDDVEFTWEPAGEGDMEFEVQGNCFFFETGKTPDDGAHTVSADDLVGPGEDDGDECTGTVDLARGQSGSIDDAFTEGGRIRAYQVRRDTFRSLPPPPEDE
jgi:hypothetical protein